MKNNIGVYGLGVMGKSLALNIGNHGYSVSLRNRKSHVTEEFIKERVKDQKLFGFYSDEEFIASLEKPRKIILMVKAGEATDQIIEQLLPLLDKEDILIECGNAFYKDTERRMEKCNKEGIRFLGVGVSGGETGALLGPSIMPSGDKEAYGEVKEILEAIAAKTQENEPSCSYIGPGGSGHFVKMVHNGIEYGDIQIICEGYQLMKEVLKLTNEEISKVFENWNKGRLSSYLIEITSKILKVKDPITGGHLVDSILDTAGQKGTGKWTTMESLEMGVAAPTIGESVFARILSSKKGERVSASKVFSTNRIKEVKDRDGFLKDIEKALYISKVISYAQGFTLLREASESNGWNLDYGRIALLWREGCIIRASFLKDINEVYKKDPNCINLMVSERFSKEITDGEDALRRVAIAAIENGVYIPCISSALNYFDGYSSERLPANLLQAQRDYFGAHTYQRIDRDIEEVFHTDWEALT
ncbi:decarboxylating NADP(+)-dependent phosphogluconate dehydrogenase [Clostridium polynesiense]|uniref:decarboxylating NADP(+)-dependent phosphogluconate dehydrogenase n=1 Tax=Clostridium polynesiense TaxID=1325933 RepID=UPI00058DF031|nr:decarboxylating NADP(+)-dependent phosphogluconate dehydrogenase [Clostridium polynesiense]